MNKQIFSVLFILSIFYFTANAQVNIVRLTDKNFRDQVIQSDDLWFVLFNAKCGSICSNYEKVFDNVARKVGDKVKFGKIDEDDSEQLFARFKVKSFPHYRVFPKERAQKNIITKIYDNNSTSSERSLKLNIRYEVNRYAKVKQLTNQSVFEEHCGVVGTCYIAFLKHIKDTQNYIRNDQTILLRDQIHENFKFSPVSFLWSQAGDQPQLEQIIGSQNIYPFVVGINLRNNSYTVYEGEYDSKSISEYISQDQDGTYEQKTLEKIPVIENVEEWDGNNYQSADGTEESKKSEDADINDELRDDL